MYFSIVILVLTKALYTEICDALNVTVTPGHLASVPAGDNVTLSCLVSQRKRSSSFLVLRWFFTPPSAPTLSPPPPSPPPPRPSATAPSSLRPSELLIVKMGMKKMKFYGNYTRHFPQPKFRLYEDSEGEVYRLLIVNVALRDEGWYTCRVQEIRRHRNAWKAASNGTGTTFLTVHFTLEDSSSEGVWRLFADVYLCAVLICSLGLLSIFLFTLVLTGQYLHNRHRLKASYLLVKCPESSSGETVTSSVSSSGSSPRTHRKESRQTSHIKAPTLLHLPEEPPPPHTPAKVPSATQRPRKPRRLKNQSKRSVPPKVSTEDSLTYAELELVRPRLSEPPADPSPSAPGAAGAGGAGASPSSGSDTVYAQILFQERQL